MSATELVEIAPYDPAWPARFESERKLLTAAVGRHVVGAIEHVGSTSVPGLAAKPIVDIQIGVASLDESLAAFGALEAIGYGHAPVRTDVMHYFEKRSVGAGPCNLQLIPYRSDCWNRRIAFRSYLRSHPEAARGYAALKQRLAEEFRSDIRRYNAGKSDFIRGITERALSAQRQGVPLDDESVGRPRSDS